jgi:hypothetical protein
MKTEYTGQQLSVLPKSKFNVSTEGKSVIRRLIAGDGVEITSSTGADSGTGDVTLALTGTTEGMPVGIIIDAPSGVLTPEEDYLVCDGSAQLRSAYPDLSDVITEDSLTPTSIPMAGTQSAVAFSSIAASGSMFAAVCVAAPSLIAYSTNGTSWTVIRPPVDVPFRCITWNGSVFCAVPNSGNQCITSPDGITWTARTLPAAGNWTVVGSNNSGRLIALVSASTIGATSDDNGATWTQQVIISGSWNNVAWATSLGLFCVVSSVATNTYMTSPDGITWTSRTFATSATRPGIAWNGTVFAVSSTATASFLYSSDGVNWGAATSSVGAAGGSNTIIWNGSIFVCVAGTTLVLTSPDGITWSTASMPSSAQWQTVAWNGTVFYCKAYNTTAGATSTNGTTWTAANFDIKIGRWGSVAWNGSLFCAVQTSVSVGTTNAYATSPDGITWTQRTLPSAASLAKIIWNGTIFCAIGGGAVSNAVFTSTNGTSWSSGSLGVSQAWSSVAYGNGIFVAVALTSTTNYATSTNGTSWTGRTLPVIAVCNAIEWNGSVFCIVGNNICFTSTNGIAWTQRTIPTGSWVGLTWNGTVFVAIKTGNTCAVSQDGTVWDIITLPISSTWTSIAWDGSRFWMFGNNDVAAVSADGRTWTTVSFTNESNTWSCAAYGGGVMPVLASNYTQTAKLLEPDATKFNLPLLGPIASGMVPYIKVQ